MEGIAVSIILNATCRAQWGCSPQTCELFFLKIAPIYLYLVRDAQKLAEPRRIDPCGFVALRARRLSHQRVSGMPSQYFFDILTLRCDTGLQAWFGNSPDRGAAGVGVRFAIVPHTPEAGIQVPISCDSLEHPLPAGTIHEPSGKRCEAQTIQWSRHNVSSTSTPTPSLKLKCFCGFLRVSILRYCS